MPTSGPSSVGNIVRSLQFIMARQRARLVRHRRREGRPGRLAR